jgi:molecular chaperone DnaJ
MNRQQAYKTLELKQDASDEDAKKAFRKLAAKYHPDVNKENGSEEKFKKINEAYQVISKPEQQPQHQAWNPFGQQHNPFGQQQHFQPAENIDIYKTISFKDAVFGSKIELKYNRKIKCQSCQGQGEVKKHNGCDLCGGKGQLIGNQGGMIFVRTCNKCYGRVEVDPCKTCNEEGIISSESSVSVSIPGGIENGNVLRLGQMGNYSGQFGPFEQTSDVFLHISVEKDPDISIRNQDVISTMNISLLQALQGFSTNIRTLEGDKEISIPPASKNKEEISIPNLGVNRTGNHNVIINVNYPDNLENLINSLKEI